ncbi:MAG: N-acetyltransferase family protein [Halobacteria archaeon]
MTEEPKTGIRIRRLQPRDGNHVRELNRKAMSGTPEYVPEVADEDLQDVSGCYIDMGGEFLVAETDGEVVGTGAYRRPSEWKERYLEIGSGTVEVTRMRVDPGLHGHGIGTAVYEELEKRARSEGYSRFVLDTGAENETARGFYESLGFDFLRVVSVEFGGSEVELVLYGKKIGSDRSTG